MSRVKKLLFAVVLMFGIGGIVAPASAVVIHEEVTVDTDQISPSAPPTPGAGDLISVCLVIGGSPTCIVI
ncbi:MAG: hypothetical protein QOG87_4316 [Actinomycetota bacterium]